MSPELAFATRGGLALTQLGGTPGTYCLAAALVEGAHCGVKLVDGERHGGQQRGGGALPVSLAVRCIPGAGRWPGVGENFQARGG